jgi:hypothetical protein
VFFYGYGQKAYEAVYYKGRLGDKIIRFVLGNGYIGASELKLYLQKKPILFYPEMGVPDQKKQIRFEAFRTGRKDYFILDHMEDVYEQSPSSISGTYCSGGKIRKIQLYRLR